MTGIELLKRTADRRPHMIRILLTGYTDVEALVEAVNCRLVYMYISKPWSNDDLKLRVSRAVEHYENTKLQHSLAANNERLEARLNETRLGLVKLVAGILELRDPDLCLHAVRVSKHVERLGERLGLSEQLLWDMKAASFLHDLGDIDLITGEICSAIGEKENAPVRKHLTARAANVVSCVAEFKNASDMVRYHYENFDGSGGPLGLIGEQIPLGVRILRVAKSFDLLTTPMCEGSLSHERAMEKLRHGSGKEYDPVVVQAFSSLTTGLTGRIPVALSELQHLGTN
jgi:response regulator RpfG family c-di-GMP phosphodiesterase